MKLGQGNVFTGICDSVHGGGGGCMPQCMLGCKPPWTRHTPPDQAHTPRSRPPQTRHTTPRPGTPPPGPGTPPTPPEQTHPPTRHTPLEQAPREADTSIRSMSGQYASYWNAFLFYGIISILLETGSGVIKVKSVNIFD